MTSQTKQITAFANPEASLLAAREFTKKTREICFGALETAIDLLHLKKRHVLTRDNRLRLRYMVSGAAGLAMTISLYTAGHIGSQATQQADVGFMAALENSQPSAETADHILSMMMPQVSVANGGSVLSTLDHFRDGDGQIRRDKEVLKTVEMVAATENPVASPASQEKTLEIGKGDTFGEVLENAGLGVAESQSIISEISRHYNLRGLRPGQEFDLTMQPADTDTGFQFERIAFSPDPLKTIEVYRDDDGDIASRIDEKKVTKKREAREVDIDGSVYGSADKADLPDRITANTISLFSYAVDFQRDVHQGDKMQVLYDSYRTDDGYLAKTGDIIFARMNLAGKEYAFYRYESKDGQVDYYTADGKSIRKSEGLMKTPVSFGRLSSGFGMRRHPVLGYTKMHKGVDFAAPTGTKVYASGDGVIEKASRFSSFGNYIRIRHNSKLSTAYAHLNGYAKGIRPGIRVKQGQLIGYVGTTGRSTGPHLHYEVLMNGVQVNPKSVKVAIDNSLNGKELKRFKETIRTLNQQYAKQLDADKIKLASNE
ncbi:MAG: peptidoglycan DD-metalloendopeptidase family protein [Pseudobdellovibrionaceae bacterium]|jgi:murein DD-endopeptidase MepM/ murein hydrolase activator NlpD|nr:peptidoglycan DD-metalloendopeptidase family protein [Pseudobdellovibrionaceae bacterium]